MIETDDPLIRLKQRVKNLKGVPSLLFLKLITSIIRFGTFCVKSLYNLYMAFRNARSKQYRGTWLIILITLLLAVASLLIAKHMKIQSLKGEQERIQIEKQEIEQELEEKKQKIEELEKQIETKDEEIEKLSLKPTKNVVANAPKIAYNGVLEGKVSHYSRAGCLGCSPNLTMANGEPLDDNRLTIAVPPGTIPMNTQVRVINETTGKEVIATVTDTGGFSKYNRVADLTPAVASELGTQTDISHVRIEPIQ